MQKYGVLDIGSNSVRLMIWQGKTLDKKTTITKLAQGLSKDNQLDVQSVERTAQAVFAFYKQAKELACDKVFAFATAAVRSALNRDIFISRVKELCGLEVQVISGSSEASLGITGALDGKDGGIIDIGGASTEICAMKDGKITYSLSQNIGTVRLLKECGDSFEKRNELIRTFVKGYGEIPKTDYYGIGGTATTLASVLQELEPYDRNKTNGYVLDIDTVKSLSEKLDKMTLEEREELKGLQKERADVIPFGARLMYEIMVYYGLIKVTVSENDNLEGFIYKKLKGEI